MNTVLFACVHNAGRSQMAAAWFNALADATKARAISAGTAPGARVHPEVLEAMREVGIDLGGQTPQRLTGELAAGARLLITMGCGDQCPVVPGLRRDDWPLEDPKGKPIERVRAIRDEVRRRVAALLAEEGWQRWAIRSARPADQPAVEALLAAEALPVDGVAEHFGSFLVAERDGRIVGAAGLELYGSDALLRSLVVAKDGREAGLGSALTQRALDVAVTQGARTVYLLTTTADAFFARFGFVRVSREDVPEGLQQSRELRGACPASAVVMRRATSSAATPSS